MSSRVSVTDIEIRDLSPKIKDPRFEKYLPKTLFPKHMEFVLGGVSGAVANGIRRTIMCELLVSAMYVEYEDIQTNDKFIIPELVMKRLRMIPIDQSCPLDATFELNVTNTTDIIRDVKASEIRIVSGGRGTKERPQLKKLPFNETFTLFTLEAGMSCKITNIGIHQDFGFIEGSGMHVVAFNCASVSVDQIPINVYEPDDKGIPSSISNPRVWRIKFNTNGTMRPESIIAYACDNIIQRVQSVQDLLYLIQNNNDEYVLVIDGESDTIGNLFMKTICDIYPDIRAVAYSVNSVGRVLTMRVRCDEDINSVFTTAIKHIVRIYTEIKKHFE